MYCYFIVKGIGISSYTNCIYKGRELEEGHPDRLIGAAARYQDLNKNKNKVY